MRAYSREKQCDTGRKAILMRSVSEKQWLQRQVRCGDQRERECGLVNTAIGRYTKDFRRGNQREIIK